MRREQPWNIQADMLSVRLQDLFTRRREGFGPRSGLGSAHLIYEPMVQGRIRPRLLRIPARHTANLDAGRLIARGRETLDHAALKAVCLAWMDGEGAPDAAEERWCAVGKADVFSESQSWIIECGNTAISKLQDAILDDRCPRFTLVPYQPLAWRDGSPRALLAVEFDCDEGVRRDMRARQREELRLAVSAGIPVVKVPALPQEARS